MGWNESIFPLLIIAAGPGFSGEFTYAPGPGPGNLITSNAATDGTDPYGNAYIHGLMTYTMIGATQVAQGIQDGEIYFGTAPGPGGPYTQASGKLRSIGSYQNGFISGQDVNGNSYPVTVTQLDAHSIALAGRIVTPAAWVTGLVFGSIGAPFLLPAAGSNTPEFPTINAAGSGSGSIVLRPNGNMELVGNDLGPGYTMLTAGTFRF